MKQENLLKHVLIAFILAIVFYIATFTFIQHRRSQKGPWQVIFLTDQRGAPSILVSQSQLKIANIKLVFPDQALPAHNLVRSIFFDAPGKKPPFGEVRFIDTTYLPGTVVLDFWGHEVQLMPRSLTVDKKSHPWESGSIVVVSGPAALPAPVPQKYKQ